jgi:hypothetical protein
MACNTVGSPLPADLDPEDMRDLVATFHQAVDEVTPRFGGFVPSIWASKCLFIYPAGREDEAEQAARAGRAVLDAVGA